MENITEINQKIAKNLAYYRKAAGYTQAELAEKINYSDKSVSKWESGGGIPDVYILMQLAKLYKVTLNDLVGEENKAPVGKKTATAGLHLLIMLLSSGIVWLVATCAFVALQLLKPNGDWWLAFLYATVVNAIVLVVYAAIWKYRLVGFISVSALIWTAITSLYLTIRILLEGTTADLGALWCVFLIGIPLQVLEVLWVFFRSLFRSNKAAKRTSEGLQESEETENV